MNKTLLDTVLVLVLILSLSILASPIAKASDVETAATIVAVPDPIGVGQIIKLIGDINPNPPTSPLGFSDISIIITYPTGSNVTLGPFLSNGGGVVTLQFVPDQVGFYNVRFTFLGGTLSDGHYYQPCEAATNFTVQPELVMGPVGSFTVDPTAPEVDETVTFDASNSSDLNGNIVSYEWDYGDQTTGSGVNSTHAYSLEGIYTVTLTIIDNDGIADITTKLITVMPNTLPPEAPSQDIFEALVVDVIDGDTFDTSEGYRIRLADIDAPEMDEPGYLESTEYLELLIEDKTVILNIDSITGTDPYGRYVCLVYVEHNSTHCLNVNQALVEGGYVVIDNYTNNEFEPNNWTLYSLTETIPEVFTWIVLVITLVVATIIIVVFKITKIIHEEANLKVLT